MEVVRELREIPNLSLALGFFDGVHLGHQAVIKSAVTASEKYFKTGSGVVTFNEHPYSYFKGVSPKYIMSAEDKYNAFEELGVDYVIELDFSKVCRMSPVEYMENVLIKYFSPKVISTGFDHKFGADKSGNVLFLSTNQGKYNYTYVATPPQSIFGSKVSSTQIRSYIKSGVVDMVSSMLGRKFLISGEVIKGRELGRTIGFPTANILYPADIVELPYGVYDVDVELDNSQMYRGLANYGLAPTVTNDAQPVVETYLLNFDGDLYDKNIKLHFRKKIRSEVKFNSIDELKTQIAIDLQSLIL